MVRGYLITNTKPHISIADKDPNPDPHDFGPPGGMDPDHDPALDPDPSIIKQI